MVCSKCGGTTSDNDQYCQHCGNRLTPMPEGMEPQFNNVQPDLGQYAGFWLRFVAYIIDALVLILPTLLFRKLLGTHDYVSIIVDWLYFALMESSSKQATLGKMALGLKVTDLYGERIGFGRATGRYFSKIISAIILCIGYMMAGWTQKKQALHDMIASTLVYRKQA